MPDWLAIYKLQPPPHLTKDTRQAIASSWLVKAIASRIRTYAHTHLNLNKCTHTHTYVHRSKTTVLRMQGSSSCVSMSMQIQIHTHVKSYARKWWTHTYILVCLFLEITQYHRLLLAALSLRDVHVKSQVYYCCATFWIRSFLVAK